jgi:hypothetical protein
MVQDGGTTWGATMLGWDTPPNHHAVHMRIDGRGVSMIRGSVEGIRSNYCICMFTVLGGH